LASFVRVNAGILMQDVPCTIFQFAEEVRLVVVKAFH